MSLSLKSFILFPLFVLAVSSCTDYGKKVSIPGSKGEVYYKGPGVSEAEAKTLGVYLKDDLKYFDDSTVKSVQLLQAKSGGYDVRFVVDENKLKTISGAEAAFQTFGSAMSIDLYKNQPVNIFLADDHMKDVKSLPFDKKLTEDMMARLKPLTSEELKSYDHDSAGGVQFYWKDISDQDSKIIADYIVKNGAFEGGKAEIYMTRANGKTFLKFPVRPDARADSHYLNEVEKVAKEIKANVFPSTPYSFSVTDENLVAAKTWDL